jgi:hypothetical protein
MGTHCRSLQRLREHKLVNALKDYYRDMIEDKTIDEQQVPLIIELCKSASRISGNSLIFPKDESDIRALLQSDALQGEAVEVGVSTFSSFTPQKE